MSEEEGGSDMASRLSQTPSPVPPQDDPLKTHRVNDDATVFIFHGNFCSPWGDDEHWPQLTARIDKAAEAIGKATDWAERVDGNTSPGEIERICHSITQNASGQPKEECKNVFILLSFDSSFLDEPPGQEAMKAAFQKLEDAHGGEHVLVFLRGEEHINMGDDTAAVRMSKYTFSFRPSDEQDKRIFELLGLNRCGADTGASCKNDSIGERLNSSNETTSDGASTQDRASISKCTEEEIRTIIRQELEPLVIALSEQSRKIGSLCNQAGVTSTLEDLKTENEVLRRQNADLLSKNQALKEQSAPTATTQENSHPSGDAQGSGSDSGRSAMTSACEIPTSSAESGGNMMTAAPSGPSAGAGSSQAPSSSPTKEVQRAVYFIHVNFCSCWREASDDQGWKFLKDTLSGFEYYTDVKFKQLDGILSVQNIDETAARIEDVHKSISEEESKQGNVIVYGVLSLDESNRYAISHTTQQQSNTLKPVYDNLKKVLKNAPIFVVCRDENSKWLLPTGLASTRIEDTLSLQVNEHDILLSWWKRPTLFQISKVATHCQVQFPEPRMMCNELCTPERFAAAATNQPTIRTVPALKAPTEWKCTFVYFQEDKEQADLVAANCLEAAPRENFCTSPMVLQKQNEHPVAAPVSSEPQLVRAAILVINAATEHHHIAMAMQAMQEYDFRVACIYGVTDTNRAEIVSLFESQAASKNNLLVSTWWTETHEELGKKIPSALRSLLEQISEDMNVTPETAEPSPGLLGKLGKKLFTPKN